MAHSLGLRSAGDVADEITNALRGATIVMRARVKQYLIHQIAILFMAIFTVSRVRISTNQLHCSSH